jgi:hypothetical protein
MLCHGDLGRLDVRAVADRGDQLSEPYLRLALRAAEGDVLNLPLACLRIARAALET